MNPTIDAIVDSSTLPVSIVIVGVQNRVSARRIQQQQIPNRRIDSKLVENEFD